MRNRIIGIAIVACALLMLFAGTATGFGSFLVNQSPQLLNIITTAPTGARYSTSTIVAEIATDLLPILWVPEVVHGAISGGVTFGNSTFSKIPRIINVLTFGNDPETVSITFDLSALSFLDMRNEPLPLPQDQRRRLTVYIEGSNTPYWFEPGGIYTITCGKEDTLLMAFEDWDSSYFPFFEYAIDSHSIPVRVADNILYDTFNRSGWWTKVKDLYDRMYLIFSVVEPSE